jgi:hypothetical protein
MVIIYYNNEIELILANSRRVKDVNVRVKNHSFSQEV